VASIKRMFGTFGAPSAFEVLIVLCLLGMTLAGLSH
jgi:hypothetical protein